MALQIVNTGVNIATSGTSAGTTIPLNSSGAAPLMVRVAASAAAYVRFGVGAQTAVNTDLLVQPGDAVVVVTGRATHVAALQVSGPGVVQVSAVEGD